MKQKIEINDDVNINVNVEFPAQDLEDLIDRVTESIMAIVLVTTVSHIVKSIFTK